MRPDQRDPRRLVPVVLTQLPLDTRLAGARAAMRLEPDPEEKLAILAAALNPSPTVYWIEPGVVAA